MWLLETNLFNLVQNKWISLSFYDIRNKDNSAKNFVLKLRNLRIFLKNWNINVFSNIKIKKDNILNEMLKINKIEETRQLYLGECNVLANLKEELNSVLEKEEVMWKQRSRIQWIDEGDYNTIFFHNMANGRKRINTVNSISINNETLVDQRDLNKAFTDYYRDIFGAKINLE